MLFWSYRQSRRRVLFKGCGLRGVACGGGCVDGTSILLMLSRWAELLRGMLDFSRLAGGLGVG